MTVRIAIVEDDRELGAMCAAWLNAEGYTCTVYETAKAFQSAFRNGSFDLVTVDWELPDATGLDVLRFIRETADWYVPVMFVTGRDQERDAIRSLDAGADDFISKPAGRGLMMARVRALLRRAVEDRGALQFGDYRIDRVRRQITVSGRPVALTDKEFQLADLLLSNADQLLSRDFLLETIWGNETEAGTRTVDTHASRVRQKLGFTRHNEFWLRPVYGRGYRLVRKSAATSSRPAPRIAPLMDGAARYASR
ncbi:MAG: response regulator transcription factor [Pseudomonadota bacterium]